MGIRRFVAIQAVLFWSLILAAWWTYPGPQEFSIFTHTFSFLGSFNPEHHPRLWWIFSIAMYVWGLGGFALAWHLRRIFSPISATGATMASLGVGFGCLGVILVGVFPDARQDWKPGLRYTEIHTYAAYLVALGYGWGLGFFGLLLLKERIDRCRGPGNLEFPIRRVAWPLAFWHLAGGTCLFRVLWWEHVYAERKAAALSAGRLIGSSWAEGLGTWHAFPLWENLAIYSAYSTLAWLAWVAAGTAKCDPEPRTEA